MRYVALLRGVNVGGRRRVGQAEFKQVLERMGFRDVVIYLNMGNAVFTSDSAPEAGAVQTPLEQYFGFDIDTVVLPSTQVQHIAASIPDSWSNDPLRPDKSGQKSDVLYLFESIDSPEILDKLGYNPAVENMKYVKGAVLANVSRRNQSKSSLKKVIGSELYAQMTVRNVNTARKLAELSIE